MDKRTIFTIALCLLLTVAFIDFAPTGILNSGWLKAISVIFPFIILLFFLNRAHTNNNYIKPSFDPRIPRTLLWGGALSLLFAVVWLPTSALIFSPPIQWGGFSSTTTAKIIVIPFSSFLFFGLLMLALGSLLVIIRNKNG